MSQDYDTLMACVVQFFSGIQKDPNKLSDKKLKQCLGAFISDVTFFMLICFLFSFSFQELIIL